MAVSLADVRPRALAALDAVWERREQRRAQQEAAASLTVPDFWTSQSHSTIRTQHGEVPFVPFPWQREFIDSVSKRELLLKSRDVGSSEICVRFFCWMMLKQGGNLLIKADKWDNAKNLVRIARQYLTSLPEGERPKLLKDNETEIEIEGRGTIRAMAQGGGRSERCRYLLMTERAFWENAAEELRAISGTLVAGGWEIIESTANGFNEYHDLWAEQNGYRKTFVGRGDNPTHDAAWWEQKQSQAQDIDPAGLRQEYPETSSEAFISSGRCVFDTAMLLELATAHVQAPIETRENGAIRIWQKPVVGRRLVVGADVAEGKDAGNDRLDYSDAYLLDWETCETVATIHCQLPPEEYAELLNAFLADYASPLLGVECNSMGSACLLRLRQLGYPRLFARVKPMTAENRQAYGKPLPQRELGWLTTAQTKPLLEAEINRMVNARVLPCAEQRFWDEALSYVHHGDGTRGAQPGKHDDMVIAHGIALMMRHVPIETGKRPTVDVHVHPPEPRRDEPALLKRLKKDQEQERQREMARKLGLEE